MLGNPGSFPGDLEYAGDALKSRESPAQTGRLVMYALCMFNASFNFVLAFYRQTVDSF